MICFFWLRALCVLFLCFFNDDFKKDLFTWFFQRICELVFCNYKLFERLFSKVFNGFCKLLGGFSKLPLLFEAF